jgi:hypothetical protein
VRTICCIAGALAAVTAVLAATPQSGLQIGAPVLVSSDAPSVRHAETVLAVNPRDPLNLIVAAIRLADPMHTVVYATHDAGRTWVRALGPDGSPLADREDDPAVTFDAQGRAYFTARSTSLRVRRSTDGGGTWDAGTIVPGRGPDREWLVAGPEFLFAISKQELLILDSVGEVFAITNARAPLAAPALIFEGPRLMSPSSPVTRYFHGVNGAVAGIGKTVLMAMTDCDRQIAPEGRQCRLLAAVSQDGGWTYGEPATIANTVMHTHKDTALMIKGLAVGGLAVDTSDGPARGRLYAVWSQFRDGRYQIATGSSGDNGRTWSAPVIVNDDQSRSNHSNPGIAVNAAGVVGVVWMDRRNDPADICFQPYFAGSFDGGRTFGRNAPVTSTRACPIATPGKPGPERFAQGGDTFGIAATPDGAFHVAWVGPRAGDDAGAWRLLATTIRSAAR